MTSTCTVGPLSASPPPGSSSSGSVGRDDADRAAAVDRLERVDQQVGENLPQLVRIALDGRQVGRERDVHCDRCRGGTALGQRHRVGDRAAERHVLDLQPDRPHELEHLERRWRWPSSLP